MPTRPGQAIDAGLWVVSGNVVVEAKLLYRPLVTTPPRGPWSRFHTGGQGVELPPSPTVCPSSEMRFRVRF